MKCRTIICPYCGQINRNLILEETEGWMECVLCGRTSNDTEYITTLKKVETEVQYDRMKYRAGSISA